MAARAWSPTPLTDARMAELDRAIARQPEPEWARRLHVKPKPVEIPQPEYRPPTADFAAGASYVSLLHALWAIRPCLLCRETGHCGHREPDVEIALLEAAGRRMRGAR